MKVILFARRPFDFYVDSVTGNDANRGTTPNAAFKTIGALGTLVNGSRIGLARGSIWREQLGADTNNSTGVTVGAYGSGPMPILDGADVAAAGLWSKTASKTNVYQITWTHANSTGYYLSLWENGTRLRWVADTATCDSTAGSYFAADTAGTSATVYVHPTGNGDPASNGKTYEISRRLCGVEAGSGWRVTEIHTRRSLHVYGSLVGADGKVSFQRCLAEDGTKHNLLIGADSEAVDCIAWKSDWPDRTNTTGFVAFTDDGRGHSAQFVRCKSVMELDKVAAGVAVAKAIDGFLAHAGASNRPWDSILYTDCAVRGAATAYSCNDCGTHTNLRPYAEECQVGAGSAAATGAITDFWCKDGTTVPLRSAISHFGGDLVVDGLRTYPLSTNTFGDVFDNVASGSTTIRNSVMVRNPAGTGTRFHVNGNVTGTVVNSDHNIIVGDTNSMGYRAKGTGAADFNCYFPNTMNFEVSATYLTFATYIAGEAALDQHSIAQDPLLNDPANGDFGTSGASPARAIGAGLLRPSISYINLPSDAALAAL